MKTTCGYCLFAEETDSNDVLWCWKVKKYKDVMDPGCAAFRVMPKFEDATDDNFTGGENAW